MPYELTDNNLKSILAIAKEDDDIVKGLSEIQVIDRDILNELGKQKKQIQENAAIAIKEFIDWEMGGTSKESRSKEKNSKQHFIYGYFASLLLLLLGVLYMRFGQNLLEFLRSNSEKIQILDSYLSLISAFLLLVSSILAFNGYRKTRKAIEVEKIAQVNLYIAENVVKPFLRLFINDQKNISLETKIKIKDAPGIWSFMDAAFEIPTNARAKAERLIKNMSGGSIGVAGPRGVGKSTLLNSICNSQKKDFLNEPVLTVITSVPVVYDAKDFILHLFSLICQKVIDLEYPIIQAKVNPSDRIDAQYRVFYALYALISKYSFIVFLLFVSGLFGLFFSLASTDIFSPVITLAPSMKVILTKLEITFGDIFKFSILLLIIPIFVFLFTIPVILRKFSIKDFTKGAYKAIFRWITSVKSEDKEKYEMSKRLSDLAVQELETIKFQQSFATGWSESLSMPDAIKLLDVSAEFSRSKTRRELTLPEIVSDFKRFVSYISVKYKKIFIGIDELDKIATVEMAQRFLNEIKAIFGIPSCFYLVSISDNALSNFERRGLNFRDEFDTSFDDVVYVETLGLDYSTNLLKRRVIGLPLPYIYFCHVISGGLPRDLIRVCRNILDIAENQPGDVRLEIISKSTIIIEVLAKTRAISIAVSHSSAEPDAGILLSLIKKIEIQSPENWLKVSNKLFEISGLHSHELDNNAKKLSQELAAYLLFFLTTLEYFTKMGQVEKIDIPPSDEIKALEDLAQAKLMIASGPEFSRNVINEFRSKYVSSLAVISISDKASVSPPKRVRKRTQATA